MLLHLRITLQSARFEHPAHSQIGTRESGPNRILLVGRRRDGSLSVFTQRASPSRRTEGIATDRHCAQTRLDRHKAVQDRKPKITMEASDIAIPLKLPRYWCGDLEQRPKTWTGDIKSRNNPHHIVLITRPQKGPFKCLLPRTMVATRDRVTYQTGVQALGASHSCRGPHRLVQRRRQGRSPTIPKTIAPATLVMFGDFLGHLTSLPRTACREYRRIQRQLQAF
ncbi:hypothetical protein F5Y17DRAFT_76544 [Xylariaceae sp. FL0594]|nr:hypothetical protein F5Y17DRAFT_76544 [Xylariaceae sp. FL0594]